MKTLSIIPKSLQKGIALSLSFHFLLPHVSMAISESTFHVKETQAAQMIKIALLLDTSNSMDGLIDQAKAQLWSLVNELSKARGNGDSKPTLQIALYEYGNDRLSASEGYVRLVTPLTDDLDKVSGDLFGLTTNGGSEFCGKVIQTSLRQLDWNRDGTDLQLIFIAGNEPFNQGNVDFRAACGEAKGKNVVINSIYCGNFDEGVRDFWKQGADIASGTYMSIQQDRKTVYVDSPYDDEIVKLNSQLNDTYIYYGNKGLEKKEEQTVQDKNASTYGKANAVNRAVTKTKHVYKTESWDLVEAEKAGKADLKTVDKKTLPKPMQTMNEPQMQAYVQQKSKEREEVKNKIAELNKKRDSYVREKQKEQANSDKMLDKAMIHSIKEQAKVKKMKFEE